MPTKNFDELLDEIHSERVAMEQRLRDLMEGCQDLSPDVLAQKDIYEIKANMMLAIRNLQDVGFRMRNAQMIYLTNRKEG